jgi:hypothetical protein
MTAASLSKSATIAPVHRFVEGEQASLVCEELADRDMLLAVLRALRQYIATRMSLSSQPREWAIASVIADNTSVAECATTIVSPRQGAHRVATAAPEIDDFPATVVDAARSTQFVASREVLEKASRTASKPRLTCPSMACELTVLTSPSVSQHNNRHHDEPCREHGNVDPLPKADPRSRQVGLETSCLEKRQSAHRPRVGAPIAGSALGTCARTL